MNAQTLIPFLTGEAYGYADGEVWPELRYHNPIMVLQRLAYALGLRSRTAARERGHIWPAKAVTMVGKKRAENIAEMVDAVCYVDGALVDCGVWRGGSTMIMASAAKGTRRIYCCDTFDGFPPETAKAERVMCPKALRVSQGEVKGNFERYGVPLAQVVFLAGKIEQTLLRVTGPVALLRLDVDLYAPTLAGLWEIYPKMPIGGRVIIDDYGDRVYGCKAAVDHFRGAYASQCGPLQRIDSDGVWWEKIK